jgi:short-subunit dehydrogenase
LLTGASSGIGLITAELAARNTAYSARAVIARVVARGGSRWP